MAAREGAGERMIGRVQEVLGGAEMLKTAVLDGDPALVRFAVERMSELADGYSGDSERHGRFSFDELAETPVDALPEFERLAADLLASALVDLEVANTLMIAGELSEQPQPVLSAADLEGAMARLEHTAGVVGEPIAGARPAGGSPVRFAFDEVPEFAPAAASPDQESAKEEFRRRLDHCLASLVERSKAAVQDAFKGVQDLDTAQLAEAAARAAKVGLELPQVGRLAARGVALARSALQKMVGMFGDKGVEQLKKTADESIERLRQGSNLFDQFLAHSYQVEAARRRVAALLAETAADAAQIDRGHRELAELERRFAQQMTLVTRIVEGVGTGRRVVGIFLPKAATEPIFAGLLLISSGYVVLCGMDYADSAVLFRFVNGVLRISEGALR